MEMESAAVGQAPEQCRWGRWAFLAIGSLLLTVRFAWGHSPLDLAYVIVTYVLIVVLCCCVVKLNLLRRDDPTAAPEQRRVSIGMWVVSVALAIVVTARFALVTPNLWLKIPILVFAGVVIGLPPCVYFFLLLRAGNRRPTQNRDLENCG